MEGMKLRIKSMIWNVRKKKAFKQNIKKKKEFKTMVIRMLKELIGHFNKIKKTQAEMNLAVSEIKKNL